MSDDWFGRWPSRIHSGAHLIHGELLKLGFEILSGQFLGWCAQHDSTCDLCSANIVTPPVGPSRIATIINQNG
jgi:hypothetical protein